MMQDKERYHHPNKAKRFECVCGIKLFFGRAVRGSSIFRTPSGLKAVEIKLIVKPLVEVLKCWNQSPVDSLGLWVR
jgi:hypothetical protein